MVAYVIIAAAQTPRSVMATNGLPIGLYEDLLPKLVAVLESRIDTTDRTDITPEAKQKLLQPYDTTST